MTTEERVRRIERENRWMKVGGGALMLCLLVVLFGGAGQDQDKPKVVDEVRARSFVLVNGDGERLGELCSVRQRGYLAFYDSAQEPRVELGVPGDVTPALAVFGRRGNLQVRLGTDHQDNALLQLSDAKGRINAAVQVRAKGGTELWACSADGRVLFEIPKQRNPKHPSSPPPMSEGGGR